MSTRTRAWAGVTRVAVVAGVGLTVGVLAGVLAGCTDPYYHPSSQELLGRSSSSAGASAPAGAATSPAPTAPAVAAAAVPAPAGQRVRVLRVIDGDTFEITGGARIRVLGIDSCEAGTDGGRRATADARRELSGQTVTLTGEPGVDRDRYNRELRYVSTSSGDLGKLMVAHDHTAVYAGHNDASPAYLTELTALDGNRRTCDDPDPVATPAPANATGSSSGYVATPAPSAVPGSSSAGSAYYKNCSEARAAGAAPLRAGQPGYSTKLDRDGDGIACE